MPKHITLDVDHGEITIELLDNSFVDFWVKHHESMMSRYSISARPTKWPFYKNCDQSCVDKIVLTILATIDQINTADYLSVLPELVTEHQLLALDLSTQQVLNRLHRYAVVCADYRDRWHLQGPVEFEFVPWENQEFMYLINVLNQSIHQLEDYVVTPHKQEFSQSIHTVEFVFQSSLYQDVDVFATGADLAIPTHMQQHLRLLDHDVWIKKDLLGKDFVTAFADHDDPAEFDIRPQNIISGSVSIDVNNWREQFFNSSAFGSWLGQPVSNHHGSYPLGNVVAGKNHLQKVQHKLGGP